MKEIKINDKTFTLKKTYLTNGEINYMVSELMKIYNTEEDIEGYDFSPLSLMTNFYSLLFEYCIEDYNTEDISKYEELYNNGVHKILLENITNADEALQLVKETANKVSSLENIISKALNKFIDKVPGEEMLSELTQKLPTQFQDAINKYNDIFSVSNEEDSTE